jgi:hypothetical protein
VISDFQTGSKLGTVNSGLWGYGYTFVSSAWLSPFLRIFKWPS